MGVTNASYYTNIHEIYKKRKPNGAHIKNFGITIQSSERGRVRLILVRLGLG
jgi:hypothetical protein